ncbi:MAG: ABC-F family ATP-binding cassette domain-containing protein [Rhodobacteraceae bacterium]|nr:ABC-F family ATP-binding cassette domain-containing protein [Paracoccaceae bacterium]
MSLISVRDLGVTFASPLFSGLSLTIHPGDRIGLVAANGRGKSTLLACLAGTAEPTFGEVTRARGLLVGHVEQEVPGAIAALSFRDAVRGALPPEQALTEGWRVDIVLDELDIPEDLRDRPVAALSGGWQRLALLARVWVTGPDLLLLDEPTNHLDLERIGRLQEWLGALPRDYPFVVANHDRAFLDAVTNRTLFLRATRSQTFALPYSQARAALDTADDAEDRRFANEMQKAGQLRRQAAKLKNIGINSGSDLLTTKTKQLNERAEKIEAAARPAHKDQSAGAIRLAASGSHARALVTLEDAPVAPPGGTLLYRTGQKWISPGERIVLLGPNGAGKSLLLDAIRRAAASEDVLGVKVAPSMRIGVSDQGLRQLDDGATPLAEITGRFDLGDQGARTLLAGAGIGIDLQSAPVARLSGGQRARLAMLVLRLTRPNFYLLDEPTNHLDIEGQEALERELLAVDVAALVVTHDRSFLRAIGNRFWVVEGRRLVETDDPEPFLARMLRGGGERS